MENEMEMMDDVCGDCCVRQRGCSNRKESLRAADGIADIGQQTI